jgi:hypothetical protein
MPFGSPELILLAAIAVLLVVAPLIPQNRPLPATVKPRS